MFVETTGDWQAVEVVRPEAGGPIVLVCEHAGLAIPRELGELGLDAGARRSHAAWDIGARDVAEALSEALDAPLVAGVLSRLVYDLNRPLEARDSIPGKSEIHAIPGNSGLSDAERQARFERVHVPFHGALAALLDGRSTGALVTVHSFTPVYLGQRREVELGFLYHSDARMAQTALRGERVRGSYRAALNEPYGPDDGVTYTLHKHGEARGLPALMIEIRNDLIDTPQKARAMAAHLAPTLSAALVACAPGAAAQ